MYAAKCSFDFGLYFTIYLLYTNNLLASIWIVHEKSICFLTILLIYILPKNRFCPRSGLFVFCHGFPGVKNSLVRRQILYSRSLKCANMNAACTEIFAAIIVNVFSYLMKT